MSTRAPKRLSDGFINVSGGVDNGKSPTVATAFNPNGLPRNKLHFLINGTVRGDRIKPRPGYKKTAIAEFESEDGKFQGGSFYQPPNDVGCLIASIDGRIWRFNVGTDNSVQEIVLTTGAFTSTSVNFVVPAVGANVSITVNTTAFLSMNRPAITIDGKSYTLISIDSGTTITARNNNDTPAATVVAGAVMTFIVLDPNPSVRPMAWMYQAEQYLIIQDNQSKPIIYDGGAARRANPREVPVGSVGTYGMGRIWQVLQNGTTFAAGDLVYSITGTTADVLGFTENTFLNEGGAFSVPSNAGIINAARFLVTLDTSMGQGPLQMFTGNTIFSVNAPVDREQWKNLTYPIQTTSMVAYGALNQNGTTLVNGDVFYRSLDGIRSFIIARRTFKEWGNTPISREMRRVIDFDDTALLKFGSSIIFDNRLLQTCSPFNCPNGVGHRALIALDFDLISSMSGKEPPAWEGMWTGLTILQVIKGTFGDKERAFAFVSNDGIIEVWEITKADRFDKLDGVDKRIAMTIETGSYPFNSPFDLKRLVGGDLWNGGMAGDVDFDLKYRPDEHACWLDWQKWSDCAEYEDCETPECGTPTEWKPQYRPKKKFNKPPEDCDELLDKPYADLFECQVYLKITGYCEVKQLRIHAMERQESQYDVCP